MPCGMVSVKSYASLLSLLCGSGVLLVSLMIQLNSLLQKCFLLLENTYCSYAF